MPSFSPVFSSVVSCAVCTLSKTKRERWRNLICSQHCVLFVCFFTVLVFPGIFLACCARLFLFCHHHISLSCLPYISCYLADFVTVYKCFLYPVWKQSNSSSFAPLQLLIILCFAMLQNAFVLWLLILLAMLRFFKKKKKSIYCFLLHSSNVFFFFFFHLW